MRAMAPGTGEYVPGEVEVYAGLVASDDAGADMDLTLSNNELVEAGSGIPVSLRVLRFWWLNKRGGYLSLVIRKGRFVGTT